MQSAVAARVTQRSNPEELVKNRTPAHCFGRISRLFSFLSKQLKSTQEIASELLFSASFMVLALSLEIVSKGSRLQNTGSLLTQQDKVEEKFWHRI
jgi:hypothetical protein